MKKQEPDKYPRKGTIGSLKIIPIWNQKKKPDPNRGKS
jgi:hypothetical protein